MHHFTTSNLTLDIVLRNAYFNKIDFNSNNICLEFSYKLDLFIF